MLNFGASKLGVRGPLDPHLSNVKQLNLYPLGSCQQKLYLSCKHMNKVIQD